MAGERNADAIVQTLKKWRIAGRTSVGRFIYTVLAIKILHGNQNMWPQGHISIKIYVTVTKKHGPIHTTMTVRVYIRSCTKLVMKRRRKRVRFTLDISFESEVEKTAFSQPRTCHSARSPAEELSAPSTGSFMREAGKL